jgi:hypothetical protein
VLAIERRRLEVRKPLIVAAVIAAGLSSLGASQIFAQGTPILDRVAQHVIEKYQNSSCAQIAARRGQPPDPMQQRAVQLMRNDPQLRAEFIGRVAAPIANKLFECQLIP